MRPAIVWLLLTLAGPAYAQWHYPPTKQVDARETYFGSTYEDPYRWLENLKDDAVRAWFKAQALLTDDVLAKIPARDALVAEWTELDRRRPASYRDITYEHGRVFYKKTLGGENVGKLYYRQGWRGAEKLLFDPSTFQPAGARPGQVTTIADLMPSPDGRRVVLGLTAAGTLFSELRVLDVERRTLLPDSIYPSRGAHAWTMDSRSFFYDAGPISDIESRDVELNRKTCLHQVGSPVASDIDVFSDASHPELAIEPNEHPFATIDESFPGYVIGQVNTVQSEMRVFYAPAAPLSRGGKLHWQVLAKTSDQLVRGMEFHKGQVYAVTHAGAARYKLVRTSIAHPDWQHAETVIPEARDSIATIVKSKSFLYIVYSDGIVGRIVKYGLDSGKTSEVQLPTSGSVHMHCPDWRSDRCIVSVTSWVRPTTLYDFDADKDHFVKSIFDTDVIYPGFENLVTEEVEVPAPDGTLVPLSIIHRKDLRLDGSSSAILEGYGAYGFSIQPRFDIMHSVALHGVVLAYAHVRGGGEKGEAWYRAGFKSTKPNTWNDFIACAEYLVNKGYTSAAKLAGRGTSAGGVLISRAITERPELFGAAVCNVGCANTMRMEFTPNGPANTPEFGTVKDQTEAAALYEMDGLQHVRPGVRYPALLGVAGWNDTQVAPWQPGKLVAAMQAATTSGKPVLMKVNYDNGHSTEEKTVTFKNFASQTAFMLWQTGYPEFQPTK
jgi:prolyl oligopeptidase